jgi:Tfp pilus assembly protein PilN
MIQFNLLPDIKLQYIKTHRLMRLVMAISALVTVIAVCVFVLLFLYVDIAQKVHLRNLKSQVSSSSIQLTSSTNLSKILTIQNQLTALPQLEAQTPAASRMFPYLTELTPTNASITNMQVNFTLNTFSISGTADSLDTVNKFVDALKFTTYSVKGSTATPKAFSTVVLSAFGYGTSLTNNQPATFTITFDFDPTIFSNSKDVTLTVPQITTTRSVIAQPSDLFVKNTTTSTGGQ